MLTLYIANRNFSSWSLRPWVLLAHLGIPFETRLAPFAQGSNWVSFRAFSPTGKVPCLHDAEQVVWDSMGIAEHLADRHPEVWPSDVMARSWARCAAAEMHSGFTPLRTQCPMNCGYRVRLLAVDAPLQADLRRLDELWCEGLSQFGGPFLAGEAFTAVDAAFAPVAFRIQTYGLTLSEPALAYAQRLLALPAMQQWYADALAESFEEPAHDAACLVQGELLADLRHRGR